MISIYDKSNVYYIYDVTKNVCSLIGNFDELLSFLAKNFRRFQGESNVLTNFKNEYFEDINMGDDYNHEIDYSFGFTYPKWQTYPKRYLFFDGFNRTVDVRDFKEDAFKIFLEESKSKRRYYFKRRIRQGRHHHSGNRFKGKMPKRMNVKKLDSILKSDYKDYHFKNLEDSKNPYPDWWDDTHRRVEENWKSQYKVNKQYGIHKNSKDAKSIRNFKEVDLNSNEIDDMLFEDFLKNLNE